MAGITFRTAIWATPRTPHRTLFRTTVSPFQALDSIAKAPPRSNHSWNLNRDSDILSLSVFRHGPVLCVQVDAHNPLAIDVVGLKELFQSGLVWGFNFREHSPPNLAAKATPDFHLFTIDQRSH
jgi:hypothetical protein